MHNEIKELLVIFMLSSTPVNWGNSATGGYRQSISQKSVAVVV
jgi:hypothetical protein